MSLSNAINAAVAAARRALGDLITTATLKKVVSETYDTAQGKYVPVTQDISIQVAPDRFSYNEQLDPDYQMSDLKLIVFNPDNSITINTSHRLVYEGVEYGVRKSDPTIVGGFRPIWTVMLRK